MNSPRGCSFSGNLLNPIAPPSRNLGIPVRTDHKTHDDRRIVKQADFHLFDPKWLHCSRLEPEMEVVSAKAFQLAYPQRRILLKTCMRSIIPSQDCCKLILAYTVCPQS